MLIKEIQGIKGGTKSLKQALNLQGRGHLLRSCGPVLCDVFGGAVSMERI